MAKRTQAGVKTSAHVCKHPFEQLRRECAAARQVLRDKRSAKDQLAELDKRLGVGQGAERERARLAKQAEKVEKGEK